ncbi:MAG: DUF6247 family protein [Natronosporangium sp.]
MTGSVVRAALDPHQRALFEAQFRAALVEVTRDFEVDRLAEVVRRWWVIAGGDPAVANQDRVDAARAASLTGRAWPQPRPIHLPSRLVDQTGPAVRAALPEPTRIEFETQFEQALVAAAESFDHLAAHQVVIRWWAVALQYANPDDAAQDRETARQVEFGELTTFIYH